MKIRSAFTRMGEFSAHPAAFLILLAYAGGWLVFERDTFDWHAGATLFTWAMTLFIQRSETRDTLAVHAKLDELLRTSNSARDELTHIDDEDLEDVKKHRDAEQEKCDEASADKHPKPA